MTRGEGIAIVVALAAAAGLGYAAFTVSANADLNQPQKQAAPADQLGEFGNHNLDGHPGVICEPRAHLNGYTYTQHRYPRQAGGEITAVIHRGFSPMRVPRDTPDAQWIVAPPSEAMF